MLKYILAVLAVAVAWGVVLVFEQPKLYAIIATAVIVTILAIVVIAKFIRAKRAEKAIEQALSKASQAPGLAPEQAAKIEEMRGEFTRAIAALKASAVGRKGGALYALPWYVIIGPPGAGKTTAIRNSGLDFPYLSATSRGGSIQGLGGTLHCDWWMSNRGILLDTAGRYSTQSDDRDEWHAFLEMLRKHRPQRPINGLLVAVSVRDLMHGGQDALTELGRTLRSRVDEMTDRLGCSAPVYLLLTMADLVVGFAETFGPMEKQERQAPWGFTFPIERPVGGLVEQGVQRFDELCSALHERCVQRVTEHGGDAQKSNVYGFARHLAQLRNPLAQFLHAFGSTSVYTDPMRLRGIYLTSGTQEGAAIDQMMGAAGQAMGLAMPFGAQAKTEARSYFLGGLFSQVIFPDRLLARRSSAFLAKQRKREWIAAGSLFGVGALIALTPLSSARNNRALQNELDATIELLHDDQGKVEGFDTENGQAGWKRLVALETRLDTYGEDTPVGFRWGMYQGEKLRPTAQNLLLHLVREQWVLPTVQSDESTLRRFSERYESRAKGVGDELYRQHLALLHRYLNLTGPASNAQPELSGDESQWLQNSLASTWSQRPGNASDTEELLQAIAARFVHHLARDASLRSERDERLVQRARAILLRTDRDEAFIWQLVDEIAPRGLDISLRDIMSTAFVDNNRRVVRGAFTRQAWESIVRERLSNEVERGNESDWILGTDASQAKTQREQRLARLRHYYFVQYESEWRTFISSLRVQPPSDAQELLLLLADLTNASASPYKSLFQHVRWNTTLSEKPKASTEKLLDKALDAGQKVAAEKVNARTDGKGADALNAGLEATQPNFGDRERFRTREDLFAAFEPFFRFGSPPPPPPPGPDGAPTAPPSAALDVETYENELRTLKDALRAQIADTTKSKELQQTAEAAENRVEGLIDDQEASWRTIFGELLRPPLMSARSFVQGAEAGRLENHWCTKIVYPFEEQLLSRYPFNASARAETALSDLTRLIHPEQGELWRLQSEILQRFVRREGSRFVAVDRGKNAKQEIEPNVLDFFEAVWELAQTLYPRGREEPLVEFEVFANARSQIQQTIFTVDGDTYTYENGPKQVQMFRWPGDGDERGASLRARFQVGAGRVEHAGEWGFFRLLEEGSANGDGRASSFSVSWQLQESNAGALTLVFEPRRATTPFFGDRAQPRRFLEVFRLRDLKVPHALFKGGQRCPEYR